MSNIGNFLTWMVKDIEKESKDELAASSLQFKDVAKAISQASREWFIAKVKNK